jgi:hypothetical protein
MRKWTFGDWVVFAGLPSLVAAFIVLCVYSAITDTHALDKQYKQQQKQEQQFANTFYQQCMKAHGVYDVGSNGYICFGDGSILFQSGFSQDLSPKG